MEFMNQPNDLERLEETIAVLGDDALIRRLTESEEDLAARSPSGPIMVTCLLLPA